MKPLYFSNKILKWYAQEKRDLPWRDNFDPYSIWISEIILQQTRIDQGTSYYLRFMEKFPTLLSLATANQDEVLKLWQGLGYYSRARNLHFGAQQVLNDYHGIFPTSFLELKKIKGVGDYTAAAIASIAFNEPVAAVDGNVYRVLSRIFGIDEPIDTSSGKKQFAELANQLLDRKNAGDYNQALMEFGALHCKPKQPLCQECPFSKNCFAYTKQIVDVLPVKSKKVKQRHRFFYYLCIHQNKNIYFKKRTENDIWRNLFDFPLIEFNESKTTAELFSSVQWNSFFENQTIQINHISNEVIHLLSHQKIHVQFIGIQLISENILPTNFIKIDKRNIFDLAVPKLIENYLSGLKG
ncbi:MAG: A/G-specific adenine glycosylase [Prolixibacteraceae bacterium]